MLDEGQKLEVKKILSAFGHNVLSRARNNFRSKSTSGKGIDSMDFDVEAGPNSFSMPFSMEKYMEFQDKGVSGTERKFNTPFRYTNKKPPAKSFDKWAVRKGLAGRDEAGRFVSRKSLTFALANYIYKKGIRPSNFFTNAFESEYPSLPDTLIEAYGLDIDRMMAHTLKDNTE